MRFVSISSLLLLACGAAPRQMADGGVDAGPSGGPVFIALQGDFAGYHSWQAFDFGEQESDTVHIAGHQVVYLKQAPPHGSTTWPQGTLLVKEVTPDGGTQQIFGMAKRGGAFNPSAPGWEWFELAPDTNPPVFLWRGAEPPMGAYGEDPNATCDACHGYAASNDYVIGMPLFLSGF